MWDKRKSQTNEYSDNGRKKDDSDVAIGVYYDVSFIFGLV